MHDTQDNYLCQVSETVSCGACCGLYNLPHLSRVKLETMLSKRTEDFMSVVRTEDGIFEFQRRHKAPHRLSRPYPQFHHCPFLGFIGDQKSRVGCLLHPDSDGNNNNDYRFLSWYGEQACPSYFCPATRKLPPIYKSILAQAIDDWYVYGLIVTEYSLVIAYFRVLEARLGRDITADDFTRSIDAAAAFREFTELKSKWPHRREGSPGPCNFFFENGLYTRPDVFRSNPKIRQSFYEEILRELDSGFSSEKELTAAEEALETLFMKAERALA